MTKNINQRYFDQVSRERDYVYGAFFSGHRPLEDGFEFRSRHKDLVHLVWNELRSKHAIGSDPRGKKSFWFTVRGAPYLCSRLEEFGLGVPKSERVFPDVVYLRDFLRGFLDCQARVRPICGGKGSGVFIKYNQRFLERVHSMLTKQANVQRDPPKESRIFYAQRNTLRIHDFLYHNLEGGLYLASKKNLYKTDFLGPEWRHPFSIEALHRIEQVKEGVKRKPAKIVANQVGYGYVGSLYRAFKRVTGQTVIEYRKQNQQLVLR